MSSGHYYATMKLISTTYDNAWTKIRESKQPFEELIDRCTKETRELIELELLLKGILPSTALRFSRSLEYGKGKSVVELIKGGEESP